MEYIVYPFSISVVSQQSLIRRQNFIFNPLFQLKVNAFAAYSVRKVNTTYYNGPFLTLRRDSDGATADLYCDELGLEAALLLFSSNQNLTSIPQMKAWGFRETSCIWSDGMISHFQRKISNSLSLNSSLKSAYFWIKAIHPFNFSETLS